MTRDESGIPGGPTVPPGGLPDDEEREVPDIIWPDEDLPLPTFEEIKEEQEADSELKWLSLELAIARPQMDNQPVAPDPDDHLNILLTHGGPRDYPKALETGREQQTHQYDRRANWRPFKVGDPVWLYKPGLTQGLKNKLALPYESQPYCVIKLLDGLNAVVKKRHGQPVKGYIH